MQTETVFTSWRLALAAALLLSACGGGDGGAGGEARFLSKAGAQRELGLLANLLMPAGSPFAQAQSPTAPRFAARLDQAPMTDCVEGSAEQTAGERDRPLRYYDDPEQTADFTRYVFDDCRREGAPPTQQDGVIELGRMQGHDPRNLADSADAYVVFGEGAAPYHHQSDDDGLRETLSGSAEWRDFDTGRVSASVIARSVERGLEAPYVLVWEQGSADEPLRIDHGFQSGIPSIQGPYRYASSRCPGGERRLSGSGLSADEQGYPVAGELVLSAAAETLTIRFDGEGAAAVSFSDGGSASLTAEEVRAAFDRPGC